MQRRAAPNIILAFACSRRDKAAGHCRCRNDWAAELQGAALGAAARASCGAAPIMRHGPAKQHEVVRLHVVLLHVLFQLRQHERPEGAHQCKAVSQALGGQRLQQEGAYVSLRGGERWRIRSAPARPARPAAPPAVVACGTRKDRK